VGAIEGRNEQCGDRGGVRRALSAGRKTKKIVGVKTASIYARRGGKRRLG